MIVPNRLSQGPSHQMTKNLAITLRCTIFLLRLYSWAVRSVYNVKKTQCEPGLKESEFVFYEYKNGKKKFQDSNLVLPVRMYCKKFFFFWEVENSETVPANAE